jgi:hypothetical protein
MRVLGRPWTPSWLTAVEAIAEKQLSGPFPGALHSMCTWARLKIGSILWALLVMAGSLLAVDRVFAISVR